MFHLLQAWWHLINDFNESKCPLSHQHVVLKYVLGMILSAQFQLGLELINWHLHGNALIDSHNPCLDLETEVDLDGLGQEHSVCLDVNILCHGGIYMVKQFQKIKLCTIQSDFRPFAVESWSHSVEVLEESFGLALSKIIHIREGQICWKVEQDLLVLDTDFIQMANKSFYVKIVTVSSAVKSGGIQA